MKQSGGTTPPFPGQPHMGHSFLPPSGQRTALFLSVTNNGNSVAYSCQHSILWQTEVLSPSKALLFWLNPISLGSFSFGNMLEICLLWRASKCRQMKQNPDGPVSPCLSLSTPWRDRDTQDTVVDPREVTVHRQEANFTLVWNSLVSLFPYKNN